MLRPTKRLVIFSLVAVAAWALLVYALTRGPLTGASGKAALVAVCIGLVTSGVAGWSLLLGGGIRCSDVSARYFRLSEAGICWVAEVTLGPREALEVFAEYKFGKGQRARFRCYLARPVPSPDTPTLVDERQLTAIRPHSNGTDAPTEPESHAIVLRTNEPGRYFLGIELLTDTAEEIGVEFAWARTLALLKLPRSAPSARRLPSLRESDDDSRT